jgi:hypothetical protein
MHFMFSANSYMFKHQGAIIRQFNPYSANVENMVSSYLY